jgi:KRAB domain-containing zinc finger protein
MFFSAVVNLVFQTVSILEDAQVMVRQQNGHIAEPQKNCVQSERCKSGAVSCDVPKTALRRHDTLKNHQNIHSGQRLLLCEVRKTSLKQGSPLETPCSLGSECQFSCGICKKSFKHQYNLKLHVLTHSAERTFSCDVCNKPFDDLCYLKKHLRLHGNERPYICKVCKKSFKGQCDLKVHLRTHSGERPFSCDICDKSQAAECIEGPFICT